MKEQLQHIFAHLNASWDTQNVVRLGHAVYTVTLSSLSPSTSDVQFVCGKNCATAVNELMWRKKQFGFIVLLNTHVKKFRCGTLRYTSLYGTVWAPKHNIWSRSYCYDYISLHIHKCAIKYSN